MSKRQRPSPTSSSNPPAAPPGTGWLVLSVQAPPRGEELLLVDALRRVGGRAVEREGERFLARLPPPENLQRVLRAAESAIRASTTLRDPALAWWWEPLADWEDRWQQETATLRVTERIIVTPAAREVMPQPGEVVIRLAAGAAFGTAEHPTTRGCLRYLDRHLQKGERVADIGAGSGILAIAAALLGAREVVAVEADAFACVTARANLAINRVGDRVAVRQLEITPSDLPGLGRFDGIMANLEAAIILPLLPGLSAAAAHGGWVILSGILSGERDQVVRAAADAGLVLQQEEIEQGWWTGCFAAGALPDAMPLR